MSAAASLARGVKDQEVRPARGGRGRPHQLPSGRHGLQRSFVVQNQRERILSAVAVAAAELGFAEMTVEAVIERAGVSRRTFYDNFRNKEEAFLAAYEAAVRQQAKTVQLAYLNETTMRGRLRAGLDAYMRFMANEPEFARMCMIEVLAAGPRAIERRNDAMRMFAKIIEQNIRELVPGCTVAPLAAETIVGGIYEVVYNRVFAGRTAELPGLVDDLLATILMVTAGRYGSDPQ